MKRLFFLILTVVPVFYGIANPLLDYRVFKTKYVDVIYQKSLEASIYDFVSEVDRLYEDITSFYGILPDERLRVIITDDTDIPNAFAIPFDDSIHIYACGNSGNDISSDYKNWYRFVFTHELTHVLLGNYFNPYYSILRTFGDPLPSLILSSQIPLYLHEGLSIFTESKFNDIFGRLNDARFQMYIRGDLMAGKFRGLEIAGGYFSHRQWAPAGMMYEYGASLIEFIVEYFGVPALKHFLYEFFNSPASGIISALKKISEEDMRDFVEKWKKHEQKKAEEIKRWVNYHILRVGKRLTYSGWWTGIFDVSKDGKIFYFEDNENSESSLSVLDLENRLKKKVIGLGKIPVDIEVSPSGRYVAIVVNSQQYFNIFSFNELIIYDTVEDRLWNLNLRRVVSVDWYNEEELLMLTNDKGFRRIKKYNLKTGRTQIIFDETRGIFVDSFSHYNGLVYFSGTYEGQKDLFVLKLSDGTVYRLTNDLSNEFEPEISEDGRYLYFASDSPDSEYNIFNIYVADLEKKEIFRITNVIYGAFSPKIFKQGIVYRGYTPVGYDIFYIAEPFEKTYETNKKLCYERFDHIEDIIAKRNYVLSNSVGFLNYVKPRIWMFLPYVSVTEESAQFMIYQFNAFWDVFVENLVLSYGIFRTANEPVNLSIFFIGREFLDYSLNFNFRYSFEDSGKFENSMNGKANFYIPFGNPAKPVSFVQKVDLQASSGQDFNVQLTSSFLFDQFYNRYYGRFWRTALSFSTNIMKIENWNIGLMNSFVALKTLWNFQMILNKDSVSLSVNAQTPLWIIDRGTLDGRYSIGSVDLIASNGLKFSSGKPEPVFKIGFKTNFSIQYYVELATEFGIKYEKDRFYPYFQINPSILDLF